MAETIKTKVQLKRLLLVLLALVILVTVTAFAASAVEVVDSGTCGGNLTWQFDSDGTLTISGTGEMRNWDPDYYLTPWKSKRDSIKRVIIGDGVTTIGSNAFEECTALRSVTIPNGVTTIGEYAFSYCKALTSITIPNSVTVIGWSAFSDCYGLTSVTIPNSVTAIGSYAFSYCTALTSITIPNSVTAIGDYAFSDCYGLTSITIPNSVTTIGYSAFSGCTSLTSVTIPDSVTYIGGYAFANTAIYNNSSNWSGDCLYIGKYLIKAKESISGAYSIANGTKCIAGSAFSDCTALTSVTIPNSVTAIGGSAFYNCATLTTVNIGDGVTSIGWKAFYDTALYNNRSNWSGDCLYIGKYLIEAKESISGAYSIANGTKCIATGVFYECYSLKSITIPNSVTTIGDYAFSYCYALTSITIPNSVTTIGDYSFSECTALTSITIPYSVTAIGYSAFSNCKALTSVTIPNNVTAIGKAAFFCCYALTSITVPNSVTTIEWNAFYGCSSLKYVYYEGDSSGWQKISFGNAYSNPCYYGASLHYSGELVSTVTGLKVASYGVTDLKLTWTKLNEVTGYKVYKYNPTTKKYEYYKNTTSNSLTVTGLKAGTQYYFKVRAYKSVSGKVYWGDYSSYLKTATIPPTVTGLKVASYANTALKLTWTNISGVTGYKVYKYNPTTKKYESYKNTTSNSLMVTGLQAGTQYYFRVRAYKSISGRNYWGNYSSFLKTATRPLNAKISSVSSTSSGRLTAKWGKVSGATGYYVQYSTNSRFSGAKAKYVNTNYINLTGLTGGTTYYVRVRPFVQIGSAKIYSPALSAYKYIKIK